MLIDNIYIVHKHNENYLIVTSPTTAIIANKDLTTLLEESKDDKVLTNTNIYEEVIELINNNKLIQVEVEYEILPDNNYTIEQVKSIVEFFYAFKEFTTYVPIETYNNPSILLDTFTVDTKYLNISLSKAQKQNK